MDKWQSTEGLLAEAANTLREVALQEGTISPLNSLVHKLELRSAEVRKQTQYELDNAEVNFVTCPHCNYPWNTVECNETAEGGTLLCAYCDREFE